MLSGVGLGLRRDLASALISTDSPPAFVELAPENWINLGGHWRKVLKSIAERYPITCHGLSLSLGSPDPLDWDFLGAVKKFLAEFNVEIYSEHLSYTKCDNAHLYELLPIPFRESAVKHVAERIRQVQDFLERQIAIENVSYYASVAPEMDEASFITAIAEKSDCRLLLDVNNVYVNAFNHSYDAKEFIAKLPLHRVSNIHIAGHEKRSEDLIIDTHGQPIIDPVYDLFAWVTERIRPVPVLLERDFNFPDFGELTNELSRIETISSKNWGLKNAA